MICSHEWTEIGGTNAGCSPECTCSVPVYECRRCGESDYGNNIWARNRIENCRDHWRKKKAAGHDEHPLYGIF